MSLDLVTSSVLRMTATLVGVAYRSVDIPMEGGHIGWHSALLSTSLGITLGYRVRMTVAIRIMLTKASLAYSLLNPRMLHQLLGGCRGCHSLPMGGWI